MRHKKCEQCLANRRAEPFILRNIDMYTGNCLAKKKMVLKCTKLLSNGVHWLR